MDIYECTECGELVKLDSDGCCSNCGSSDLILVNDEDDFDETKEDWGEDELDEYEDDEFSEEDEEDE